MFLPKYAVALGIALTLLLASCSTAWAQCRPEAGDIFVPVDVASSPLDTCGEPLCLTYSSPRPFGGGFLLHTISYPCLPPDECGNVLYGFLAPQKNFFFEFTFDLSRTPEYQLPSDPAQALLKTWTGCMDTTICEDGGRSVPCTEILSVDLSDITVDESTSRICMRAASNRIESCVAFDFCLDKDPDIDGDEVCGGDPTIITKQPPLP